MLDYTITYADDAGCTIQTDLLFSRETTFSESILGKGSISFDDSRNFLITYYVNDQKYAETSLAAIQIVNIVFPTTTLVIGENIIKLEMIGTDGLVFCTLEKSVFMSYYNFFTYYRGVAEPKKDLISLVSDDRCIYVGSAQMNPNKQLSELYINISAAASCIVKISPIFEESWSVSSNVPPTKEESIYVEANLDEGDNAVSLIPLLLAAKPVYGLKIYTPTGGNARINLFFNRLNQSYYKIFLARPNVVYYDNLTISWEDVSIEAVESFLKFELIRDGSVIFTTSDFHERTYIDTNIQLNKHYLYQLAVYLDVPESVVWDFLYTVKDLWKWRIPAAGEDPSTPRLQFETGDYVDFGKKPINVSADFDNLILDPGLQYIAGDGISIISATGDNLFKEFLAQAEIDFTDRAGITKLLIAANMDTSLVTLVESATKEKVMGDGYLFRFKMRKRTRAIDFG